jgi:hypothetical protein
MCGTEREAARRFKLASCRTLNHPRQPSSALLRIFLRKTPGLTQSRARPIGSYGTTWSFPLLHNGSIQIVQGGQRKLQETLCDSLFRPVLSRPSLTRRKHALTCTNGTELVIHASHRPVALAHLIRVRSMVQLHLGPPTKKPGQTPIQKDCQRFRSMFGERLGRSSDTDVQCSTQPTLTYDCSHGLR